MGRIAGLSIILWLIVAVVAFTKRNDFADDMYFPQQFMSDPLQTEVDEAPFSVNFNDVGYEIEPLYQYELHGLVVSYRHHSGDSMLHGAWNDHLNMADVCVIWSDNLNNPYLNELSFWNGQFTCNVQTKNSDAWSLFNMEQLSNNHLISDDPWLRSQIKDVRIGDQIKISGWLATYSSGEGYKRLTSTTRTDAGNGACETIYVNDFQIVSRMPNPWRSIFWFSLICAGISCFVYLATPFSVTKRGAVI